MDTPYYQKPENREEDFSLTIQLMLADSNPSDVFATMWKVFLDLANDPHYDKRTQEIFHALHATAYLSEFIKFE